MFSVSLWRPFLCVLVALASSAAAPQTAAAEVPEPAEAAPAAPAAAPAPRAPARVEPYVLVLEDLQRIAEGAGLTWVNSDADKIAVAQAAIAAEPKPAHVPRERPPLVVEPLVV